MNLDLYRNLTPILEFQDILNDEYFVEVPKDWWVVVTDVIDSTKAIENGKYKDVNIAGGLSAMAISNHFKNMEIPFIFGGDGVTFLISNENYKDIRSILADTRTKVKELYSLDLRVGFVSISKLNDENHKVFLGKFHVSSHYKQAVIKGSGVDRAEELVKRIDSEFTIFPDEPIHLEANFSGFTCRWKDIPSSNGETISLIIRFLEPFSTQQIVKSFYKQLTEILGEEKEYHPIKENYLSIASSSKTLMKEAKVKGNGSGFKTIYNLLIIFLETIITRIVIKYKLKAKAFFYDLKNLKSYQVASSDYRKFDGTLKMVVSVSAKRRQNILDLLKIWEDNKHILFGIHISDRALMTCIMHADSESEVHFVDSADGGYAMAAKALKRKIRESVDRK